MSAAAQPVHKALILHLVRRVGHFMQCQTKLILVLIHLLSHLRLHLVPPCSCHSTCSAMTMMEGLSVLVVQSTWTIEDHVINMHEWIF
jgi:hypothetical protein